MSQVDWWHYRRSLASRVTLLTTFAVAISIAAISLGAYVVIRHQLEANTDASLLKRAHAVAGDSQVVASMTSGALMPSWALGAADVRVAEVFSGQVGGRVCTRAPCVFIPERSAVGFPPVGTPEFAVATGQASYSVRTVSGSNGTQYRMVAVPVPGNDATALVLAESLEPQNRMFQRLGIVMACFGVSGVVIAGLLGWGVATGGLRPVRRLTANVERAARTEDLTPLPVEGQDEIARLTSAFNGMLAALGASQDRQRQLVADASHELRTPLTSLRTNIDLLTQADDSLTGDQRAELMTDVRAQIEEMTTLIGDLVELARDEPSIPSVETIEMVALLDHALDRVRRRAPGLTWSVTSDAWWVLGDSGSVERAITNLLDNAAKWSPEGGTVHVSLQQGTLTVDDAGPGIADADLPHVFDRFYRSAESRAMPGSGLGLAIVRQVAERAGGSVTAGRSPYGGARLVLHLPGSSKPMPHTVPTGVM